MEGKKMVVNYLLNIVSNSILAFSSILLIDGLEISKLPSKRSLFFSGLIIIVLSAVTFFFYQQNLYPLPLLCYPIIFFTSYLSAFKKLNWAQIYIALISEFITTLFSSCFTIIILNIFSSEYEIINYISLILIRVILLLTVIALKNQGKLQYLESIIKLIPKHIWLLILVSIVDIDLLLVFNNYPVYNDTKQSIITFLIAILTITLIVVIFSLLINVTSKNYYTALNSLLEKQVATQISHYEKLEKLNSDMRTFRHDYINHLSSINTLIGEGCYSDAQNYIDKLTESTHRNEAIYLTGNRLADAILTDKSDSCKDFADIEFDGCITDKIENSDICIILANSLDNAIEACKKCPESGKISIAAQIRQGYWTMTMRNPTVSSDSEGIMKTSKEDEKNHGFGLLSIEKAVKKYDGTMVVSIKDGIFEMAVVLKIPIEN